MEKKNYNVDQVLDCRKMSCPVPVIKTKNVMSKMGSGEVLEMISTDPGSLKDIEAWARQTGQELLEVVHEDSQYRFYIKKVK
ncbi:MAG: sulfurtransferase TusA family protein [Nitrospirae bacterium]|nr:sulfurtransferase TusA family protein [Nitrospirota bacterium]